MKKMLSTKKLGVLSVALVLAAAQTLGFMETKAQAAGLALGKKVVKIGYAGPHKMESGKCLVNGAQMAIDEVNATGGVLGSKLELIAADSELTAIGAANAIDKMVLRDRVDFVIGAESSEEGTAFLTAAAKNKMLTLIQGTQDAVEKAYLKDKERNKYIFNFGPSPVDQVKVGIETLRVVISAVKKNLGIDVVNVGFIRDEDTWTHSISGVLKPIIDKMPDAKFVYDSTTSRDASDFSVQLSQIKSNKVHVLYGMLARPSFYPLVKQLKETETPAFLTGILALSMYPPVFLRAVGDDNAAYTTTFSLGIHPVDERTGDMLEKYKKRYGQYPAYQGAYGYLMVQTIVRALKEVKTLDQDALVRAVEKVKIPANESWGGQIVFKDTHRVNYHQQDGFPLYIFQYVQKGKMNIVWPDEIKTSDIVVPDNIIEYWKNK